MKMADLLNFPIDRVRPSGDRPTDAGAEVVIFPGVRIERGDFSLSDRLPQCSRNRKVRLEPSSTGKNLGKRRK